MAIHFYLHDCEKQVDIAIVSPETVIGRDSILQCDDKRISRQHGIIKHDGDRTEHSIQITSTHTNPIFLRTEADQVLNILTKDLTATLRHGEKFALLPDQYWFEVRFKDPTEVEEAAVSSSSASPAKEEVAVGATSNSNGELLRVRTMEEVNSAVAEQRVLPDWMGGAGGEKRKNGDESEAESAKRAKPDDDAEGGACGGSDVATVVKTDPDAAEASTSRPKSPQSAEAADQKDVKKETADSTSSPPGRPSCEFGIRCYRRTLEHRTQFAHPNDSDYRRPTFPPAPSDAPHCPFGVTCYRRNPQHFRDFQHPDSSEYKRATVAPAATNQQVPAAGQQPTVDTVGRRRRRRLARDIVIAAMVNPDLFDDSDEDDDDGGDLFDDGSDSDEYRPDGDIDGDDDDDDEDEEEAQLNFRVLNDDENEE